MKGDGAEKAESDAITPDKEAPSRRRFLASPAMVGAAITIGNRLTATTGGA